MSRKPYSAIRKLVVATTLAFGASGVALADGSSMSRFGGESYAYFNQSTRASVAAAPGWHQSHPNGLTESELQALSSNDLSAFTSQVNPVVFAKAPADPSWRQSHPNGLTERELEALSSSSLAFSQVPDRSAAMTNIAQGPTQTASTRMTHFAAGSGMTH